MYSQRCDCWSSSCHLLFHLYLLLLSISPSSSLLFLYQIVMCTCCLVLMSTFPSAPLLPPSASLSSPFCPPLPFTFLSSNGAVMGRYWRSSVATTTPSHWSCRMAWTTLRSTQNGPRNQDTLLSLWAARYVWHVGRSGWQWVTHKLYWIVCRWACGVFAPCWLDYRNFPSVIPCSCEWLYLSAEKAYPLPTFSRRWFLGSSHTPHRGLRSTLHNSWCILSSLHACILSVHMRFHIILCFMLAFTARLNVPSVHALLKWTGSRCIQKSWHYYNIYSVRMYICRYVHMYNMYTAGHNTHDDVDVRVVYIACIGSIAYDTSVVFAWYNRATCSSASQNWTDRCAFWSN